MEITVKIELTEKHVREAIIEYIQKHTLPSQSVEDLSKALGVKYHIATSGFRTVTEFRGATVDMKFIETPRLV